MDIIRLLMKARVVLNTIHKTTISHLKLRYKKFYRIIIDKDVFNRVKNQDDFICSIQMARLINTLRSAQRTYLRIPDNGRLPNTKDRIEQEYIYASILFEALNSFLNLGGSVKNLRAWKTNNALTKYLHDERNRKNSYFKTVLEPIPNTVMFHFDREAITEAFDKIPIKDGIDLAVSESKRNKDMVFNLADDLVLNYVISKDSRSVKDTEKYDYLLKYVLDISERLGGLANQCILEIWLKYAYKVRGRLE